MNPLQRRMEFAKATHSLLRIVGKTVFEKRLSRHYSQIEWEEILNELANELAEGMMRDHSINTLLEQNEVRTKEGKLNADQVIKCLQDMADATPKKSPQILHLKQHMTVLAKELRLFRGDCDGQKTE